MHPTVERVERELNKIFELFSQKWVKVSAILYWLDLSELAKLIVQRESLYPIESMLKLYLYKRIKGITTYPKLTEELTKNDDVGKLGFSELPTKHNFNHFFRNKANTQIISLLDAIAEKTLARATKKRRILDLEIVKKSVKEYRNKAREERKVANEATKLLKKLIYPQIQLKIGNNGRFTTNDLLDVLVHVAQTHDFANNGCKTFKDLHENKEVPDGDTFLYHFKKLGSRAELKSIFEDVTDVIFNFAKRNYNLLNRRKLDIAYDIHKIPYYGNKNSEYVKGGKSERGTNHFYHFLTCDVVTAGKRFTVDVVPVHPLHSMENLLDVSLQKVKKKMPIDRAFLDRGFANSKCIKVLNKNRIKFVMPMPKNERIKQWMDKSEDCKARLIENFKVSNQPVNLYLVDDEEGIKRAFITNLNVPVQLSHYFYHWYGKRWGIETGYRLKAQDFRPRTTSRNYTMRLFYFLFTAMLYNLWVLTNVIAGIKIYGKVPEQPLITTKRFSIILYKARLELLDPEGRLIRLAT